MRKFMQVLSTMTFREKVDHIWTYYKLHICAVLLAAFLLITWGVSAYNNAKEVLLSGNVINVYLTEEGDRYLTEDTFAAVGGSHHRQTVNITSRYISPEDPTSYLQSMTLMAMIEAKDLDFLLLDEETFQQYALSDFYLDLREFFTAEELEALSDSIAYVDSESLQESYPAGICLNGTAFAQACIAAEGKYYLTFVVNTPRLSACRAFWEHILNFGT